MKKLLIVTIALQVILGILGYNAYLEYKSDYTKTRIKLKSIEKDVSYAIDDAEGIAQRALNQTEENYNMLYEIRYNDN